MGETGPCGPCSEIHYDRIGSRDASTLVNADDPDVIEIWNLVFIQYNREANGELRSLPAKHIDTGMGLERLTSILQGKDSNYDTDVFMPYFAEIERIIGCAPYTGKIGSEDAAQGFKDMAYRVLADHARTITMAIADGATPSNEGRGYVLRRVLRRAVKFGLQNLKAKPGFFSELVPMVAQQLGDSYPELREKIQNVVALVGEEETAFSNLLGKGVKYFEDVADELKSAGESTVSGEMTFYMYDTLGFPIDLTMIMAAEKGLSVDIDGFRMAMESQKERGRAALREKRLAGRVELALGAEQTAFLQGLGLKPTDDKGKYLLDVAQSARIDAIFTPDGFVDSFSGDSGAETVALVLDETTFYAESGGQVADQGYITVETTRGLVELEVIDVQVYGGFILHTCTVPDVGLEGLKKGSGVTARVDYRHRRKVAPNHTMTHVLNFALRQVMGPDVDQRGSSVTEDRLRFDFSSIRGLKVEEVEQVERIVNEVCKLLNDSIRPYNLALVRRIYPAIPNSFNYNLKVIISKLEVNARVVPLKQVNF